MLPSGLIVLAEGNHMSARGRASGAACLTALFLLSACMTSRGAEELASWTKALANSQRDGPELLLFERGGRRLAFIGVQHDSDPASRTHRLIDSTFLIFKPRVVIVEGAPTSWDYNPRRLVKIGTQQPDAQGLLPEGETVPAVRGAVASGSLIIGGEPSDADVRRIAATSGVSDEDLLGFYVLRVVPQWMSQREFDDLSGSRATALIDKQLARSRAELKLSSNLLPDAAAWRRWRLDRNVGAASNRIDIEEAGPLADGPWRTSRVGAAISKARDTHLFELTRAELAKHRSVLVVFGGSHALIQLPALKRLMGAPCFRGENLERVRKSC